MDSESKQRISNSVAFRFHIPPLDHYPLIRRGRSEVDLDETEMVFRQLGTRVLPCFFISSFKIQWESKVPLGVDGV